MRFELSKQTIAKHEPNLSLSDYPDQLKVTETAVDTETYNKMRYKARRAGMLQDVHASYEYFVSTGKSPSLAAYLALAEWELATISNLNKGDK
mgnify:FL=1